MTQFQLPALDYALDALEPMLSRETLEYHYAKHHQTYVNNLNALIRGTHYEGNTLKEIIRSAQGSLFNNAAQVYNHAFFWRCMKPNGGGRPTGTLLAAIEKRWGDYEGFLKAFSDEATGHFGSGWIWLIQDRDGTLQIITTENAQTPLTQHTRALMTLDVWEHAYYIDYRNARAKFVAQFFEGLVNWDFVQGRLDGMSSQCGCMGTR